MNVFEVNNGNIMDNEHKYSYKYKLYRYFDTKSLVNETEFSGQPIIYIHGSNGHYTDIESIATKVLL